MAYDHQQDIEQLIRENMGFVYALAVRYAVVVPVDPGTTGLSAYYTMEGDVKDSSGKGNNGTLVNDPVFVDSKAGLGKALLFDGSMTTWSCRSAT